MKTIYFSPEAIRDLQNIRDYINKDFGENIADQVIKKIVDSIESLRIFPESGRDMLTEYGIISDYLCLFTNRNYVFYREEGESIRIIRILNEKQDFLNVLFGIRSVSQDTEDYWDE